MRVLFTIIVVNVLLWSGAVLSAQTTDRDTSSKDTLWVIPHTHWEGAVFKTREEYLETELTNILKALMLLKAHSEYRFALDQVCYVKPFLERYPEQVPAFRKFVDEGRLQIVAGVDTMHDNNMPSGESIVRQMLYGKGYYRDKLGVDVTVGWGLDTFGHNAQMPQILKLAGYESYWCRRGVPRPDLPTEFLWQGIDGTQIATFWLPHGYSLFYGSPTNIVEFTSFAKARFASLTRYARGSDRVALAGADVSDPEEHLPLMVNEFNRRDFPFAIRFAVPREFEEVVSKRAEKRPVVTGEFNPVFQGIYSSRIEVKQWMRNLERLLTTAEKLATLARWVGAPAADHSRLERAWEPVLFNQAHDLASGVMVDKVFAESMHSYRFSKRLADEMVHEGLDGIATHIDTTGDGTPIMVFNSLGWPRTDIVHLDVGFSENDFHEVGLTDADGKSVPVQVVEQERYGGGGLRHAKIAFVARDVPGMGYSIYRLISRQASGSLKDVQASTDRLFEGTPMYQDRASIENEHYRLTFDLWNSEMKSLVVKDGDWEALSGPANVVAVEQDGGDFWELYGTLSGGRMLAMKGKHMPPGRDRAQFSNEWVGGRHSYSQRGPVFSEFYGTHPFGNGHFATTVRLYDGVPRIDIITEIENNDKLVRYRALFPTSIKEGKNVHEIAFGAIERPMARELPAQNWIDYSDGSRGVALLNRGLPGNNVADGTLMLSLMRSAKLLSYPFHGGYEPGVSSDSGLELGKQFKFHYALVPHQGDWREAALYRSGLEFNNPMIARKVAKHEGTLPPRWGFLEVSHSNVVASALKPGREGGVILRVYEAAGDVTEGVTIKFHAKLTAAHEANLIEDAGRKLEAQNDTVRVDLRPFEIRTLKLQLEPLK